MRDKIFKILRIEKYPCHYPEITEFVVERMIKRVEKNGEKWAEDNASSLRAEMSQQYYHMHDRARALGIRDLSAHARGNPNVLMALLGYLNGKKPIKPQRYPGVESKGDRPQFQAKPKREFLSYESSSPRSHGLLSKAFWRKKPQLENSD